MFYVLKNVWGDDGLIQAAGITESLIHRETSALMRSDFLEHSMQVIATELSNGLRESIQRHNSLPDLPHVQNNGLARKEHAPMYRLDLFDLIRESVGQIGLRALMGSDFGQQNPTFLRDIWEFDASMLYLLLGLHKLPMQRFRSSREARDRILTSVNRHHEALLATPGGAQIDARDTSQVIRERVTSWGNKGLPLESCARANAALLWAANVNTAPLAFWMLWYLLQDKTLMKDIQLEVQDHVKRGPGDDKAFVSLDIPSLLAHSHLLRAVYLETLRLEAHTYTLKVVTSDCVLPGEDIPSNSPGYQARRGDIVCVYHGAHQNNPQQFHKPRHFDHTRFMVPEPPGDLMTKTMKHQHKTLQCFSGGKGICKGRRFAEAEVLSVVAVVISCWDIELDCAPSNLSRKPTSGVPVPAGAVRVSMKQRT